MPVEMFLKLAGIEGESSDAKHKGEIDVLAWSWGLSEEAGRDNPPSGIVPVAVELGKEALPTLSR